MPYTDHRIDTTIRWSAQQLGEERDLSSNGQPPGGFGNPVVSLRGISKSFGPVEALKDVNLSIREAEVVALLGDNGAGKTTLVKVLAGVHSSDSGEIRFREEPVAISSPTDARSLGIATVYQDLALCDNLDVVANLFLGQERGRLALSEEIMEREAWGLLHQISAKIPSVRTLVASLSGGQRQAIAIARSLIGEPQLVILDEPTAALGLEQTGEVLRLIDNLRTGGHAVLLITHNLSNVQAVCDRAVVLRLGRNNGEFEVNATSHEQIVAAITGATRHDVDPPDSLGTESRL